MTKQLILQCCFLCNQDFVCHSQKVTQFKMTIKINRRDLFLFIPLKSLSLGLTLLLATFGPSGD